MLQLSQNQIQEIIHVAGWTIAFTLLSVVIDRLLSRTKLGSSHDDRPVAVYRLVGLVHHTIQLPIAFLLLSSAQMWKDRMHASSPESYLLVRISSGYFLHDLAHALRHLDVQGFGYVIHGLGCSAVYIFSLLQEPAIFHFYGAGFMMWELSSYYVHFRWFMFKLNVRKKLQLINGIVLIVSYFLCRIVWGFYLSYMFWQDSKALENKAYVYTLYVMNLALNGLNVFWFGLILKKASETLRGKNSFDKRD